MQALRLLVGVVFCGLVCLPMGLAAAQKEKSEAKGGQDATFVMKASESDMAEIAMGKLAMQHAASPAVKQFAQKMVEDHTASSKELMQIVTKSGVPAAKHVSSHHKEMIEKLSNLKGADFDKMYMSGQVKAHMTAVKLFRDESQNGQDANIKAFASKTLPIIEHHLKMAQQIAGKSSESK